MPHQVSYGIIPLRKEKGEWKVFLIFREKNFWEFPKGHPEEGEEPKEAACRELFEETSLKVCSFLLDKSYQINYQFELEDRIIDKSAVYFLAEVEGEPVLQEAEVKKGMWLSLAEADSVLTFVNAKELCRQVISDMMS